MATKSKTKEKRIGRATKNPAKTKMDLIVTHGAAELIQSAVEHEAERLQITPSRNNFIARAALAAAKKELALTQQ